MRYLLGLIVLLIGCGGRDTADPGDEICLDAIGDIGDEYETTIQAIFGDCSDEEIKALSDLGIVCF